MIQIYQGVDIVEVRKFRGVIERNENFLTDVYTRKEREYCLSFKEPVIHFAGRFAAKEACMKALGTGFTGFNMGHIFRDIEVLPGSYGKPILSLRGWPAKVCERRKISQFTLSISHSGNYCVGTAVLLGIHQSEGKNHAFSPC